MRYETNLRECRVWIGRTYDVKDKAFLKDFEFGLDVHILWPIRRLRRRNFVLNCTYDTTCHFTAGLSLSRYLIQAIFLSFSRPPWATGNDSFALSVALQCL